MEDNPASKGITLIAKWGKDRIVLEGLNGETTLRTVKDLLAERTGVLSKRQKLLGLKLQEDQILSNKLTDNVLLKDLKVKKNAKMDGVITHEFIMMGTKEEHIFVDPNQEWSFRYCLAPISEAGSRYTSKWQLVGHIVTFRMLLLLAMAISCHVIPDHNPGDDVLRFDMRLLDDYAKKEGCFCLEGHLCEGLFGIVTDDSDDGCAIHGGSNTGDERIWHFFLAPLTKWDAARFLNLALDPTLRDPKCTNGKCNLDASEQAHAFFPMFPTLLGQLALLAARIMPPAFLPPTFEGLLVACGFVFNMICLVVATLSFFHLTQSILPPSMSQENKRQLAMTTCLVYGIWNPASVFFTTNYSESLFSATTLLGHYLFQLQTSLGFGLGIVVWTVGSFTRSNGILQSLWLLLFAMANLCAHLQSDATKMSEKGLKRLIHAACAIVAALIIAQPMNWHDHQGIHRHCYGDLSTKQAPEWCSTLQEERFSLYSYVQRKHWNVGFLNYYQWKQIPNFLLAAPILLLSMRGVYQWIHFSLMDFGKGKLPGFRVILKSWPIHALSRSVQNEKSLILQPLFLEEWLVHNPVMLSHYAILAILTLVGTFVAHVQISTRMILSSSPAAVWFLTYWMMMIPKEEEQPFWSMTAARWYPGLYICLGILLHVNFLPWT